MDHKKPSQAIISLLIVLPLFMFSCKGKSEATLSADSVAVEDAFKKSNGEMCKIKTTVVISYPESYKDQESTERLRQLYCSKILQSPDSMADIKQALKYYANTLLLQNTPLQVSQDNAEVAEDYDNIDVDNFEISVRVTNVYNNNDVLSFCREIIVEKNDKVTSVIHRYVNFDLLAMKKISSEDLFVAGSVDQINQMLKSKLIETQNVKDDDELYMCGFYNLTNLVITDNFYFSDTGLTWCYEPGILAVPAVGETTLLLPYEDLMRFKSEDSALNRV